MAEGMTWAEADRLAKEFGWCECKSTPSDIYDDKPKCDTKQKVDGCPFCERGMEDTHIHCPECKKILRIG